MKVFTIYVLSQTIKYVKSCDWIGFYTKYMYKLGKQDCTLTSLPLVVCHSALQSCIILRWTVSFQHLPEVQTNKPMMHQ